MLIIISPSKTLDFKTRSSAGKSTKPRLLKRSAELVEQLRDMTASRLAKLMHIKPGLAQLNADRYQAWKMPFTLANSKQAIHAFKGDVYAGLDADSMNAADLEFAQQHLRILSGLYGVLRPLDLMQPYRLEMGTVLKNPRGKDLYDFWGDQITDIINKDLKVPRQDTLINLASTEYFNAVNPDRIKARIITPGFREKKDGKYRFFSFYGKKARGLLAGYIIRHRIQDPDDIKQFDLEGYRYNKKLSSDLEWIFTRD